VRQLRLGFALVAFLSAFGPRPLGAAENVALGKTVTVSSTEGPFAGPLLVDGDSASRWGSDYSNQATADAQSVVIDLGRSVSLSKVVLRWETACASQYRVLASADGINFQELKAITGGTGGTVELPVSGTGRYLKLDLQKRATVWGYSLFEIEVWDGGGTGGLNLAKGKTATASSSEGGMLPALAVDGDKGTRWGSDWQSTQASNQFFQVDLGQSYPLGRVVLNWEAAYGKDYYLQSSEDGVTWTLLKAVAGGVGGIDTQSVSGQGRYVRMQGVTRGTGYGYSLWEMEVYSDGGTPPDTTYKLTIDVPYVEYTKIGLSPADTTGISNFETRNTTNHVELVYPAGTAVTLSELQGSHYGTTLQFKYGGTQTAPLTVTMNQNAAVTVVMVNNGGGSTTGNQIDAALDAFNRTIQTSPKAGAFRLTLPTFKSLVTGNRTPSLSWAAVSGATSYEVWMNITTSYDWTVRGNLLDRFTKVGTTAAGVTTFTSPSLEDRWTYKWYVVAKTSAGDVASDISQFSVYNPVVQSMDDGVKLINGCRDLNKNGVIEPFEDWRRPVEERVSDLLGRLSAEDKAWQMFFNVGVYPRAGWHFGGGTITPEEMNAIQKNCAQNTPWGIPTISAGDTTHGYKTTYPINSALAAARSPQLAWEVTNMARQEHLASGYRGALGPIAEVGTKAIYPRIQEGLGEDANMAEYIMRAQVAGYQNGPELGPKSTFITAKHWPSQGAGGEDGIVYDATTIKWHMKPWYAVVDANASGVMPGYAGSSFLDPNGNGAGDSAPILTYLRANMNYDKLIMTDWLPWGVWAKAANAGADVMGGANPGEPEFSMANFIAAIPSWRLNNAVYRILDVKFRMGLFEAPYADPAVANATFHTPEKVALVEKAASQCLTLLKNNNLLPFHMAPGSTLLVAGPRAVDGDSQSVWTTFFHREYGALNIAEAITARAAKANLKVVVDGGTDPSLASNPAAAVIVVGEKSYTHGTDWPKMSYWLPDDQLNIIKKINDAKIPYVVVFILPRPYLIDYVKANATAIVAAYRPGDGGGPAIANLLFGDYVPTGTLPWQLPASTNQVGGETLATTLEAWDLPFDLGATSAQRTDLRARINADQPITPASYGTPLYPFGAGITGGFGLSDGSAPAAFTLVSPSNASTWTNQKLSFSWNASSDGETGIRHYEVWFNGALLGTTKSTSYSSATLPVLKGSNRWYISAVNWAGLKTASPTFTFTYNDANAPEAFTLLAPVAGSASKGVILRWQAAQDLGSGLERYEVYVDGTLKSSLPATDRPTSPANLTLGRTLTASSQQGQDIRADLAGDGNLATRWSSLPYDGQYLTVDFGEKLCIQRSILRWESAYASAYKLQSSSDGSTWTDALSVTGSTGGTETKTFTACGRYLRLLGVTRGTPYGISLWEWENYGVPMEELSLTGLAAGTHTWYVKAMDRFGNVATTATGSFILTN